jgi:hypothetical protein
MSLRPSLGRTRWILVGVGAVAVAAMLVELACVESPHGDSDSRHAAVPASGPTNAEIRGAIERSLAWLEAHPPDAATESFADQVLDGLTWLGFAMHHPDPATRRRAGDALDQRLARMPRQGEPTTVGLTYRATVLSMRRLRGLSVEQAVDDLRGVDVESLLESTTPTTRFWTLKQLRRAGLDVEPDFGATFVGSGLRDGAEGPVEFGDAYRIFHELAPAVDFGLEPPETLLEEDRERVRELLSGILAATMQKDDAEGTAEALIAAVLAGARSEPSYRTGLGWLLDRQRDDGTFASFQDGPNPKPGAFRRHMVLTGSWALLTAADCGSENPDFCPD